MLGTSRSYTAGTPMESEKVEIPTTTTDGNKGSAMLSLATTGHQADTNVTGEIPVSPIARIPTCLACHILDLDFAEMCDLLLDLWQEDAQQVLLPESFQLVSGKAPVQDIGLWTECFLRMAAVLVSHYPDKAPEMFSHQTTHHRATCGWCMTISIDARLCQQ